jgi:hypothetical protein
MKKLMNLLTLTALASFTLSSCGVMFGGSKYEATVIAKDHPNADIYVNGNKIGKGTASGLYRRHAKLQVELKQDGCQPKAQTFDYGFRAGNFVLSILSWGVAGMVVDFATGACYKPDHRTNPAIKRIDTKNYTFTVDYSGCPN